MSWLFLHVAAAGSMADYASCHGGDARVCEQLLADEARSIAGHLRDEGSVPHWRRARLEIVAGQLHCLRGERWTADHRLAPACPQRPDPPRMGPAPPTPPPEPTPIDGQLLRSGNLPARHARVLVMNGEPAGVGDAPPMQQLVLASSPIAAAEADASGRFTSPPVTPGPRAHVLAFDEERWGEGAVGAPFFVDRPRRAMPVEIRLEGVGKRHVPLSWLENGRRMPIRGDRFEALTGDGGLLMGPRGVVTHVDQETLASLWRDPVLVLDRPRGKLLRCEVVDGRGRPDADSGLCVDLPPERLEEWRVATWQTTPRGHRLTLIDRNQVAWSRGFPPEFSVTVDGAVLPRCPQDGADPSPCITGEGLLRGVPAGDHPVRWVEPTTLADGLIGGPWCFEGTLHAPGGLGAATVDEVSPCDLPSRDVQLLVADGTPAAGQLAMVPVAWSDAWVTVTTDLLGRASIPESVGDVPPIWTVDANGRFRDPSERDLPTTTEVHAVAPPGGVVVDGSIDRLTGSWRHGTAIVRFDPTRWGDAEGAFETVAPGVMLFDAGGRAPLGYAFLTSEDRLVTLGGPLPRRGTPAGTRTATVYERVLPAPE